MSVIGSKITKNGGGSIFFSLSSDISGYFFSIFFSRAARKMPNQRRRPKQKIETDHCFPGIIFFRKNFQKISKKKIQFFFENVQFFSPGCKFKFFCLHRLMAHSLAVHWLYNYYFSTCMRRRNLGLYDDRQHVFLSHYQILYRCNFFSGA